MISTELGYGRDLYFLPFDHRGSFQEKLFGIKGRVPNEQETREICAYKKIIYDGFKRALESGVERLSAGILVDEQFGSEILRDAHRHRFITACPVEKSGQEEFDFEYGENFPEHIERFDPVFVKALVRYNPDGESSLNQRQLGRLRILSEHCKRVGRKFMFELLVPATPAQLERLAGAQSTYDQTLRPELMVRAMAELQLGGVEPDVWKVEGLAEEAAAREVARQARSAGRNAVGVIVLGRGENAEKVREWLSIAAGVEGLIGFAVGRTVFWDALRAVRARQISRDEATARIAQNYKMLCDLWVSARSTRKVA